MLFIKRALHAKDQVICICRSMQKHKAELALLVCWANALQKRSFPLLSASSVQKRCAGPDEGMWLTYSIPCQLVRLQTIREVVAANGWAEGIHALRIARQPTRACTYNTDLVTRDIVRHQSIIMPFEVDKRSGTKLKVCLSRLFAGNQTVYIKCESHRHQSEKICSLTGRNAGASEDHDQTLG